MEKREQALHPENSVTASSVAFFSIISLTVTTGKKDIYTIAILVLLVVIRFAPFLFFQVPINNDTWKSYYPWRMEYLPSGLKSNFIDMNVEYGVWFPFAKEEIAKGNFPHWFPYSFCGAPLYANHLVPVFHLPFAIALLWHGDLISAAYAFIMTLFGVVFFYLFLRNWRFSVFISMFGAIMFLCCGWFQYCFPAMVATITAIPAILFFHDRFIETNKTIHASLMSFCIAQMLIAGFPLVIMHFFYFVVAYMLWRRFHPAFQCKISISRWAFLLVIISIAAILVSAIQNYPTYQYTKISNRGIKSVRNEVRSVEQRIQTYIERAQTHKKEFDFMSLVKVQIWKRSMVLAPSLDRSFQASPGFVGPVVVLLAIIGLIGAPNRFLVIKLFSVFYALLYIYPPLYLKLAKIITGWSLSEGYPIQILTFLLLCLSALGLDCIIKQEQKRKWVIFPAIIIIVLNIVFLTPTRLESWMTQVDVFRWGPSMDIWFKVLYLLMSSVIIVAIVATSWGRPYQKSEGAFLLVICTIISIAASYFIYPYFASKKPMPFNAEMQQIVDICNNGRIARLNQKHIQGSEMQYMGLIIPPNIPGRFRLSDAFGFDSFMMQNYLEFINHIAPESILSLRRVVYLDKAEYFNPNGFLVQSCGIKYCLAQDAPQMKNTFGRMVYNTAFEIFQNDSMLMPYARLYGQYELVDKYEGNLLDDDFSVKILLDSMPHLPDCSELVSSKEIPAYSYESPSIKRTSSTIEINVNAPRDCLLYVSETNHPRWKAKLDGKDVDILTANLAFRAIAIPKGQHTIYMWFDGIDIVIGGIISLVGIVILISIVVLVPFRIK